MTRTGGGLFCSKQKECNPSIGIYILFAATRICCVKIERDQHEYCKNFINQNSSKQKINKSPYLRTNHNNALRETLGNKTRFQRNAAQYHNCRCKTITTTAWKHQFWNRRERI